MSTRFQTRLKNKLLNYLMNKIEFVLWLCRTVFESRSEHSFYWSVIGLFLLLFRPATLTFLRAVFSPRAITFNWNEELYKIENLRHYRFRPLWLRSSVVSVLQSLTTLTPWTSTAKLSTLFLERECNVLLAVIHSRVDLLLQYRQELAHSPRGEII